jgi:hypothetical protein
MLLSAYQPQQKKFLFIEKRNAKDHHNNEPKDDANHLFEINCIFQVDGCQQLHGEGKNCFTGNAKINRMRCTS